MRNEPLNERELELLTAGVDGELNRREAAELRGLLERRADAATLFEQLRADAARFRNLSVPSAPKSLASNILARLPVASPRPAKYAPRRRPSWMPAAIAASVLFTVSSASYLYFNVQEERAEAKGIREQLPFVPPNVPATEPDPNSVVLAKAKPGPRLPKQYGKPGPDAELPFPENIAKAPATPETAPLPRPAGNDLIGAGILDHVKPLIRTEIRLNPILDAGELGAMDIQSMLLKELQREPAHRLDLFTKNSAAGWDTFQKAAKAVGLSIAVDARTQDLLNRKVPVAVAVYTEALTPAEVAALLAELSKLVKAASPPAIGGTHLIPAGSVENREAKELFGIELLPAKSAKPADPKPLSADTLGKVASAVKKDRPALATAYLPAGMQTPATQSKEAKDFAARKGDRKPGTVAMVFVVR
jgi:hypothetical protein